MNGGYFAEDISKCIFLQDNMFCWNNVCICIRLGSWSHKQWVLTPGHQGWNDLLSLCRIGMEYYSLNDNNNDDEEEEEVEEEEDDDDDDNRNNNNNDNDYNHNNDTNNDNNGNDYDKNSSDSMPVTL